jgi:hypothetical protein
MPDKGSGIIFPMSMCSQALCRVLRCIEAGSARLSNAGNASPSKINHDKKTPGRCNAMDALFPALSAIGGSLR